MLTENPMIVVNGVQIDGSAREAMAVLDQIPLYQVARLEILRGPEAMSYGVGSGNGVILITMRRR